MVKTVCENQTLYKIMKQTYMEELNKTENYFNNHRRRIENSIEWVLLALAICQSGDVYPLEVRKAAKEYANKLVVRIPVN